MKIFGQKDNDKAKAAPVTDGAADGGMKDLYKDAQPKGPETRAAVKGGLAYRVIKKPMITEKASRVGTENKYVFAVAEKTNKIDIAKAIFEIYGVKPASVNIVRQPGKAVRYGRVKGRRKNWKKAYVTLPAGQTINPYEGV